MAIRCLWMPLFLFVTLGLLNGIRGTREARIRRRLRREGIDTDAVVVGHWVMGDAYYVTYRYYRQGQPYKHEEQVGSSKYQDWPRGTVIHLRYLPQNPSVMRIIGEGNHYLHRSLTSLACAAFIVAMAILLGLPWWT
ncbi:MAG TPA: DUF3592 domain-containing protein [Ktedonobacterales bacterium]|nr:DUF3592 domain-containing protein [Ktedonobacterales bacterium]